MAHRCVICVFSAYASDIEVGRTHLDNVCINDWEHLELISFVTVKELRSTDVTWKIVGSRRPSGRSKYYVGSTERCIDCHLKFYCTGFVMTDVVIKTSDFVTVSISTSSNPNAACVERRFQKNATILEFKMKLELVTGGSAITMKLELYDIKNKLVCELNDNNALLGSFPIEDGMRVHVIDKFLMLNEFTDTSNVEKFTLTEDDYNKKTDTVRSFLQKNKLGKYNEEEMKQLKEQQETEEKEEIRLASLITIDSRCEVRVPGQACRRATVMYNGPFEVGNKGGVWIGVKYDEPLGKNDGSVNGKRYFTCPPKYGGFVKPLYITVGDFPEDEYDLDEI